MLEQFFLTMQSSSQIFQCLPQNLMLSYCEFSDSNYNTQLHRNYCVEFPPKLLSAVIKRQAEFFAGRFLAQQSLKTILDSDISVNVGMNADRSPCWPVGTIGSITHCNGRALCLVSKTSLYRHIGVDIEEYINHETMLEVMDFVVSDSELKILKDSTLDLCQAITLAFSAKESIYKALYPTSMQTVDFSAAKILSIDMTSQTMTICLTVDWCKQLIKGMKYQCYFSLNTNFLVTMVYKK
ncbi:MAG: enterobactin synthetase component D [Bacteroidia bacterium]|jgi:enterobactin synthetase component D